MHNSLVGVGQVEKWKCGRGVEVPGCRISVGARALAKHVPRSLDGWWGSITGTGMPFSLFWQNSTVHTVSIHMSHAEEVSLFRGDIFRMKRLKSGRIFG